MRTSYIIPAYNEAYELPRTLAALSEAADAINVPYEIIVVNDGSEDATAMIAREAGARVIDVDLHNIGAVRNAGAAAALEPLLVFIDADTRVTEEVLKSVQSALEDGAAGGGCRVEWEGDAGILGHLLIRVFRLSTYVLRYSFGCFLFVRKEVFDAVGGFDAKYFAGEEFWMSRGIKRQGVFVLLRASVTTSSRKERLYGIGELLSVFVRILLPPWGLKKRSSLWYDGRREGGGE